MKTGSDESIYRTECHRNDWEVGGGVTCSLCVSSITSVPAGRAAETHEEDVFRYAGDIMSK